MALSNTLFAGLSGLDANQVKLNVVGNNIANANTVAFKASRALFKPQFYVTDSGGSQPDAVSGGTNPSQRGLGVVVASLEKNFDPGSIETTGKATDLAIDGNGFFVVKSDETKYTRDGSFTLNKQNQLVTTAGDFVQGYGVDQNFRLTSTYGNITIPLGGALTAQATSTMTMAGNLNASGAVASGASIVGTQYMTSINGTPDQTTLLTDLLNSDGSSPFADGDVLTLDGQKGSNTRDLGALSMKVDASTTTLGDLMGFLQQGLRINANVPDDNNPATPAPGITLEADPNDPNSQRMVITGNLGLENELTLNSATLTNQSNGSPLSFADTTDINGIASAPVGESVHTATVAYDSLGTPINLDLTMVLESTTSQGSQWRYYAESPQNVGADQTVGTGVVQFDNNGKFVTQNSASTITIDRTDTGAKSPLAVTIDFSRMTALTGKSSDMAMQSQDGAPEGKLTTFSIGADGIITGNFDNGVSRPLGQLVMANFSNVQGLIDRGGNMYVPGANSGDPVIGTPGSFGIGKIVGGALELSNVDISEEFINMIVASTGFSAASRVISTSNQLLTDLLNSTR